MNPTTPTAATDQFFELTPERMLGAVENSIGARSTGRCLALNSMENRVYEIELEEPRADGGDRVVAKFYRPGRWSRETILEEHLFIADLVAAEVPAVAPLTLTNGSTLNESGGIFFSVFPKVRGRILQELSDLQLAQVGRLLARLHNIGATRTAPNRLVISPETYGRRSIEFLEQSGLIDAQLQARYLQTARAVCDAIEPLYADHARKPGFAARIHGDCHLGNVLWQHDSAFFLDFDDMVTGPPVQDLWLIVRGRDEEAIRQRDVLLGGYEQMRAFDRSTLVLIEPLRTLRMIHYSAWIARRWADPTFKNAFPDFGSHKYWFEATNDLAEQLDLLAPA